MMLRNFLVSALILTSLNVYSQSAEQKVAASVGEFVSNIKVHGVLRTRYEGAWNSGDYVSRFQVRNARMSLEGKDSASARMVYKGGFLRPRQFQIS